MTKLAKSASLAAILLLTLASAAAQTLSGTATNGTTSKPAAGDEITLINLANGMEEAAKTKTDSSGKFTFKLTDGGPHLIRRPSGRRLLHDGPSRNEFGRIAGVRRRQED